MHNFTVKVINGSYMFQLQSSHMRPCKQKYERKLYNCSLHIVGGRALGLTYNSMYDCYT